jgi:Flp pilus assembly protein TadG
MVIKNVLRHTFRGPRGYTAVLFALLLPLFIGFVSLSVDSGVVAAARSQLSTAADAAALAGAQQLANEYRVRGATDLTTTIASANSQAAAFALANYVLGQGVTVVPNPTNSIWGGDVLVGYLDPNNHSSTLDTSAAKTTQFNSVQVAAMRSPTRTGTVPTFFSSLMGFHGTSVTVHSTATAQNYSVVGYRTVSGANVNLLPIVLDLSTYQQMMAGTTTDQYTWDPTTNTVQSGPDGIYESKLYPVVSGLPGNWGTVQIGVTDNSTSTLSAQIQYGITPAQLATFPGGVIQLDPTLTPPSITFTGNPGISAGIKSALDAIIGKPVSIPIYDQSGGNGSNAWYRVVAFAPVRIMSVDFQGNPKYVIVQPALVTDPTAIPGSAYTSWSSGGVVELFLSR